MISKYQVGQENVVVQNDGAIVLSRYSNEWKSISKLPPIISLEVTSHLFLTYDRQNVKIIWETKKNIADMVTQVKFLPKCWVKFPQLNGLKVRLNKIKKYITPFLCLKMT